MLNKANNIMTTTYYIIRSSNEMREINFTKKHDPIEFNYVSGKRHLNLNKLLKENFNESGKNE
jgi:hypothetical protein